MPLLKVNYVYRLVPAPDPSRKITLDVNGIQTGYIKTEFIAKQIDIRIELLKRNQARLKKYGLGQSIGLAATIEELKLMRNFIQTL